MSSTTRQKRKRERRKTMRAPCRACEISAMCLPLERLYAIKCQFCGKAWVAVPGVSQHTPHLELSDGREESCARVQEYLRALEREREAQQGMWDRTTPYTCASPACQVARHRQRELERAREKAPEPLFKLAEGPARALNKGKKRYGRRRLKKLWGGKKGVST